MFWRKLVLMFFVALLGGVLRLYEYNAWGSLSGYTVQAQTIALEKRFWDVFPSDSLPFWPSFLRKIDQTGKFLELVVPVSVTTQAEGMGRFLTRLKWLTPWIRLRWRGKTWCVSHEGRMWEATNFDAQDATKVSVLEPVWVLMESSSDVGEFPSGVFSVPVSTDVIDDFLQEYRGYSWFKDVKEISLGRRAGDYLFSLYLTRGKQKIELLIQRMKYNGLDLGVILEDILFRLKQEGGDHMIDATYNGKIILVALPKGA